MKKLISLFLVASCVLASFTITPFAAEKASTKKDTKETTETTETVEKEDAEETEEKAEKSATAISSSKADGYAILGDTVEAKNVTFFDGGSEDKNSTTYNEKVYLDGVAGRKVYIGNHVYFRFDESFYDKENDHDFFIDLGFYQFGPQKGQFTFQYPTMDGVQTVTVIKDKDPRWVTKRIYLSDAYFDHSIDDVGADIKIVTGVFNAYSHIEITNSKSVRYNNDFEVGEVSSDHARTLYQLGLYTVNNGKYAENLQNTLTKAKAASMIVKIIGKSNAISKCQTSMTGASADEAKALGYLEENKYMDWSGDAQAPVTQEEIIKVFENVQGISTEGDPLNNALAAELVQKADMILQPSKTAIENNLICIGYNWLVLKDKTGEQNIVKMMEQNIIPQEKLKDVTEDAIQCLYYTKPRQANKTEMVDPLTGRKYFYVNRGVGSNLIRDYYTTNHWALDNKRFVVGTEDCGGILYLYDTEKNTVQYLTVGSHPTVGKTTGKLYYFNYEHGKKVYRMDLNTFEVEEIADIYPQYSGGWGPSMTNDEKFLTVNAVEHESDLDLALPFGGYRERVVPVLNIETGEWDRSIHKEFTGGEASAMTLNHVQFNPAYDSIVSFAHEGTSTRVPDRVWIANRDTKEQINLFRQKSVSDEVTGENAGHEMWFGDGERIAFVKYPKDVNIGHSGIATVDLTGTHKEYVNDEYQYWHCCASPADDRFIVADTNNWQGDNVEIVLVDRYTGEAHLLCRPLCARSSHPGHCHPSFSADGKTVWFEVGDGNGTFSVAWMDVSDIVDKPAKGSRISVSESCEVPSYEGTINYLQETERAGEECYKLPAGKRMQVNVKDEVAQGDRVDAKITFKYFDEGFTPVKISYWGWDESIVNLDKTTFKKYEIAKKNTKTWKSATVELKDFNLDNFELIGTDFRIEGCHADLYIKDLDVEVTNVISKFMNQLSWNKYSVQYAFDENDITPGKPTKEEYEASLKQEN